MSRVLWEQTHESELGGTQGRGALGEGFLNHLGLRPCSPSATLISHLKVQQESWEGHKLPWEEGRGEATEM